MGEHNREVEMSAIELIGTLRDKFKYILAAMVGVASISLVYSFFFIEPLYSSTTKVSILVNSDTSNTVNMADIQTGISLTRDYIEVLNNKSVINEVIYSLNLPLKYSEFLSKVSYEVPSESRILVVTVMYKDAKEAKIILDKLIEVSSNTFTQTMKVNRPTIIEESQIADGKTSPNLKKNVLLGAVFGLILSTAVIIIRYMLDDKVRNMKDLEKQFSIKLLGCIPASRNKIWKKTEKLQWDDQPKNELSEAYQPENHQPENDQSENELLENDQPENDQLESELLENDEPENNLPENEESENEESEDDEPENDLPENEESEDDESENDLPENDQSEDYQPENNQSILCDTIDIPKDNHIIFRNLEQLEEEQMEAYNTLRTNIICSDENNKLIVVTSCAPKEGKTSIVFELGRAMSRDGKKVLILDANLRNSSFLERYQIESKEESKEKELVSLSDYLMDRIGIDEVVYRTNIDHLDIILSHKSVTGPTELLGGENFGKLLEYVKERYDMVLIDSPGLGTVIDAVIIGRQCDGTIFVVEQGRCDYEIVEQVMEQLKFAKVKIIGIVGSKVNNSFTRECFVWKKQVKKEVFRFLPQILKRRI